MPSCGRSADRGRKPDLLGSAAARRAFQRRLLDWYRANRRQSSWRGSTDPYRVWVSEVMLQQTRADQMEDYFTRFVARFPSVAALAAAPEGAVLKAWEGLGYYARARNLHRAARQLVADRGGRLPDTRAELAALPGIGAYTSAAIASIAFARDHAALDGNATRVLCRLLLIGEDPRRAATRARLEQAAETLLARGQAGDYNQAMMELGARVCTAARPRCAECPVARCCRARLETDDPGRLPVSGPRRARPHYQVAAGLIWRGDQLLIAQRPAPGMLAGMWEFPGGKQEPGESLRECLVREIREELGIDIAAGEHLLSVEHAYTHFRITLHAFQAAYRAGQPRALGCADWRWVRWADLKQFAFPRADLAVIAHLEATAGRPAPAGGAAAGGQAGADQADVHPTGVNQADASQAGIREAGADQTEASQAGVSEAGRPGPG